MKYCSVSVLLWLMIPMVNCYSQNDTLGLLFRNSYSTFELLRNDIGIYRDAKVFAGTDGHPASVASIGMGLVSLCIADAMNWTDDAEEQALTTLRTITGHTPSFVPDRNASGYYRHWIDMDTGAQAWGSEYSTIDSGILTSGALFCKKYFCENDSIRRYADLLWNSIDWSEAIENPETGGIYREMEEEGGGTSNTVTLPFNEYMIVAWLAMNQEINNPGQATALWNNHYADPANLLTKDYEGIDVLTDHSSRFVSSFVIQFPYYLCHYFHLNTGYASFFENARMADSLWWANEGDGEAYQWGLGAGPSNRAEDNYYADAVEDNPTKMYSPHIIAGFLPVYEQGADDLLQMFRAGDGIYTLTNGDTILWRSSLTDPNWRAGEVQGVDYATMLFGLAALPEFLAVDFFIDNNNFFEEPCGTPTDTDGVSSSENSVLAYPNPFSSFITIEINNDQTGDIVLNLYDLLGRKIGEHRAIKIESQFSWEINTQHWPKGGFLIEIQQDGVAIFRKAVRQ